MVHSWAPSWTFACMLVETIGAEDLHDLQRLWFAGSQHRGGLASFGSSLAETTEELLANSSAELPVLNSVMHCIGGADLAATRAI